MEKWKSMGKSHKIIFVLTCIFFGMLAFLFLHQGILTNPEVYTPSEKIGYRENPWVLKQGNKILDDHLELMDFMTLEPGKLYTMTTRITYDTSEDEAPYGFLHLDHIFCRVLIDGQEIFSFMPEDVHKKDRSKSPGFIYKCFPLPYDCMGKEIEIQLLPMLNGTVEYGLPDLLFGDYISSLRKAANRDAPHNMMLLICAAMGIGFIFFSVLVLRNSSYREGISIGIFCILFAAYMLTESRINNFYIGNPYLMYVLNYVALSLLPIFLICFMKERLPDKYRKFWNVVIGITSSLFVILVLMHVTGVFDFKEAVLWIHVVSFGEVALIMVIMFTMKDRKRKRILFLQSVFMFVGVLLDILIYQLHWKIGSNDATFTMAGVLAFLIIEGICIWKSGVSIYTESVQGRLYRKMAYLDELTNVGNRRAYDEEIDRILTGQKEVSLLTVISIDINNLKDVNDHFGHIAGDELIAGTACILKAVTGEKGQIFRTGGDEFVIFLYDIDSGKYKNMIAAVREKISEFNQQKDYILSIAFGGVQTQGKQILEALQKADEEMYKDKSKKHGRKPVGNG